MRNIILAFALAGLSLPKAFADNSKPSGGRFEVVQLGTMARDQFMVDTTTGKLWQHVCIVIGKTGECVSSAWREELVENISIPTDRLNKFIDSQEKTK